MPLNEIPSMFTDVCKLVAVEAFPLIFCCSWCAWSDNAKILVVVPTFPVCVGDAGIDDDALACPYFVAVDIP